MIAYSNTAPESRGTRHTGEGSRCDAFCIRLRYNDDVFTLSNGPIMSQKFPYSEQNLPPASLIKRLMAMLYDLMLCFALVMVVAGLYTGLHQLMINSGLIGYDRYARMLEEDGAIGHDPVLFILLFCSVWGFFGFFWRRTGQTLGMQVWNIRVQNDDGTPVTWLQAFMRMLLGIASWLPFGLGYLWQIVDKDSKTWTDRFSDSVTVAVPRPTSRHREKD